MSPEKRGRLTLEVSAPRTHLRPAPFTQLSDARLHESRGAGHALWSAPYEERMSSHSVRKRCTLRLPEPFIMGHPNTGGQHGKEMDHHRGAGCSRLGRWRTSGGTHHVERADWRAGACLRPTRVSAACVHTTGTGRCV